MGKKKLNEQVQEWEIVFRNKPGINRQKAYDALYKFLETPGIWKIEVRSYEGRHVYNDPSVVYLDMDSAFMLGGLTNRGESATKLRLYLFASSVKSIAKTQCAGMYEVTTYLDGTFDVYREQMGKGLKAALYDIATAGKLLSDDYANGRYNKLESYIYPKVRPLLKKSRHNDSDDVPSDVTSLWSAQSGHKKPGNYFI